MPVGGCFTIKCDGTRDKNNVEKYAMALRYVKDARYGPPDHLGRDVSVHRFPISQFSMRELASVS